MSCRVLLIGLDGCRLDVIRRWAAEGYLPTLASFLRDGLSTNLESVYPIHSIPAWTSFATGKLPVNHGIYDIVLRKDKGYRRVIPTARDIQGETLWDILSRQGKMVGVIGEPMTYPPRPVNGIMVCGWLTPSENYPFAYPEELLKKLRDEGYRTTLYSTPQDKESFLKEIITHTDRNFQIARDFVNHYDWSLTILVQVGTEVLHHHYASFLDPQHPRYDPGQENIVRSYYQYVDKGIGNLIEQAGENVNVIVISDHGFTPLYGKIYLNAYLRDWGFLALRRDLKGYMQQLSSWLMSFAILSLKPWAAFIYNITPDFLRRELLKRYRQSRAGGVEGLVDWSRTIAYCPTTDSGIYLNLKGREKEGIVEPEQRERIIADLRQRLLNEPTLQDFIEDVVRKEDLYPQGLYFDQLPDLYLKFKKTCQVVAQADAHEFFEPSRSFKRFKENIGYHTIEGTLLAKGPDIQRGGEEIKARIIDVAPTILHLLGLPVPVDMDGRVLAEMLKPARREVTFIGMEKERIKSKIKELKKSGRL